MRPSSKLMVAMVVIAIALAALACSEKVTGPSEETGSLQMITYICLGNERVASFISYRNSDSTSVVLTDVPLPFTETVAIPEGVHLQVSMTKTDPECSASVCIMRGNQVVASDVAGPGDAELWCEGW